MAKRWPSFITKDLGDTLEDEAELHRRWETYDQEMKALITAGGVHQDVDGWWVDDATGKLIGPDPEMERPLTTEELSQANVARQFRWGSATMKMTESGVRDEGKMAEVGAICKGSI